MKPSTLSTHKSSIAYYFSLLVVLLLNISMLLGFTSLALAQPVFTPEQRRAIALNTTKAMEQASGGSLKVTLSKKSGLATFLATKPGKEIPIRGKAFGNAKERAQSFLKDYGKTFGLKDASEYQIMQDHGPDKIGMEHIRIQQLFKGIPITGGQLTVHMRGSLVTAVHSKTLGRIEGLQTIPTVDPPAAINSAKQIVKKYYAITNARYSTPRLEIFNRGLLDGSTRPTQLAWFIEAKAEKFREFIWIHAQTGGLLLNFSQVADVENRQVYNNNSLPTLPGTLCRSEGGPASGNNDCDLAYDYSGDTYDYYSTQHGRDSYDGVGAPLVSTVHHCPTGQPCPYANAFWNGVQMVYGTGYATADDVVAHELTHAVTEKSANLFYYMQSGALNESYSDIFGETVDLTNVGGNDTPAVRWLMGEDLPIGAIRNMMTPTAFGDPGKVSDTQFVCATPGGDGGGVHSNSGVPNHGYALMVDGGTYNGLTITGIGLTKAGKIQYRALTQYLNSASDFLDNYNALNQSCIDLIGSDGITAGDCSEVNKALDAVEMAAPWPCAPTQASIPPLCPIQETPTDLFFDDLEILTSGKWTMSTISGMNHWFYPPPNSIGAFATSGIYNFWGNNPATTGDSAIAMTGDTLVPSSSAFMQFNHSYGFETSGSSTFWDGGVVEYSTDGGANWNDAGSMLTSGQIYGGQLQSSNPLGNRSAFVSDSFGYTASQLDLSSLANQNVRFRFRIGTDSLLGDFGWFIDDVRIYQCVTTQGPTVTIEQATGQVDPTNASPINFTVIFSESVADFATGDVTLSGIAGATTGTVTGSGTTYNVAVSGMTIDGTVIAEIGTGIATNSLSNPNSASTSSDNTVTFSADTTGPTVTIDQANAQLDPTNSRLINFTVVFSEVVSDFATGDVTLGGTAGAITGTVTGSGTTYNVAVSGMTTDGTLIATVAGGVATDNLGNANNTSTSTDNTVLFSTDTTGPTVTIIQEGPQLDPTNTSPINFTVVFSEVVTDFSTGDVSLGGTAGATTGTVTGSGTTYDVAVSGMVTNGTVTATIAGGVATDGFGNANSASTSSDNTVTFSTDTTGPTVTIDQANTQLDPANGSPIHFTVLFDEPVNDFETGDVTVGGTAGATTGTIREIAPNDGTTYDVAVGGNAGAYIWDGNAWADYSAFMSPITSAVKTNLRTIMTTGQTNGRVPGRMGQIGDSITNSSAYFRNSILQGSSTNETSHDYSDVRSWMAYSGSQPADTSSFFNTHGKEALYGNLGGWEISDAVNAGHPPASVEVGDGITPGQFSWVHIMFGTNDIDDLSWDAQTWKAEYMTFIQSFINLGVIPVLSTIPPEQAHVGDGRVELANEQIKALANQFNIPFVDYYALILHYQPTNWMGTLISGDGTHPSAGGGGRDFSQNGLTASDGYAARTKLTWDMAEKLQAIVFEDGAPDTFFVSSGTVTATIGAGVASDSLGNPNSASTNTDNTVTFSTDTTAPTVTIDQALGQLDPTNGSTINFTVVFAEPVTDFGTGDVTVNGAGATTNTVTEVSPNDGTTYHVAVTGMTTSGTVTATIAGGVASDSQGNTNSASTSTDNIVTFSMDSTDPAVTIVQALGQPDPTNSSPINFTVVFTEPVMNFGTGDVTVSGAGATTGTVTEIAPNDGTTYTVAVTGVSTNGIVNASIPSGIATDLFGNGNTASTSTDNSVTVNQNFPAVKPPGSITVVAVDTNGTPETNPALQNFLGWATATDDIDGDLTSAITHDSPAQFPLGNTIVTFSVMDSSGNIGSGQATVTVAEVTAGGTPPPNFKVAFIGDQGLGSNAEAVLQEILAEGASMVIHQGDFDYFDDPDAWDQQINNILGESFPYFASVGNHDELAWAGPNGYQRKLSDRLNRISDANCSGDLGVQSSCSYQGLHFILSGVGIFGTDHDFYISNQFAPNNYIWNICSWHKNMQEMQVGGKLDETGWEVYEECRNAGAIIVTGHEHEYARTKTLTSMQNQTIDPEWPDPNNLRLKQGSSFTIVSGIGGHSIRDQERCFPSIFPYGCNGEWASIYTSDSVPPANYGALFCTFHVEGQPRKANCYFKDISGNTPDQFTINSFVGTDTVLPQINILQPTLDTSYEGSSLNLLYSVSDDVEVSHCSYELDGVNTALPTCQNTILTPLTLGPHQVQVFVTDTSNNTNQSPVIDFTVIPDITGPTVTINQAAGQADPTTASAINFTVVFSEAVSDFVTGDATINSPDGPLSHTVTGSGTTYTVAVSGMTTDGLVTATIAAGMATDSSGNANSISTSTDNNVTFATSVPLRVTNLSVNSGRSYPVIPDGLQSGATVYIDRSYTFTTLPTGLVGATYIQTANADKNSQGASFFSFDVNQPVTVYVGHDNRVSSKPSWLAGYTLTGEVWDSTDHLIDVYHQDFPTGTVTLGGNHQAQSGFSMYTVAVVSAGPPPPPPSYSLTVTLAGSGSGTVTSNIGSITCPTSNCSDTYVDQTVVTLTAIAPAGNLFSGWSGAGCSGILPCLVTMDQVHTVTATFALEHILTVQVTGLGSGTVTSDLGSINCPGTCANSYGQGTTVTLTAVPDPTMEFTGWSGAGCSGTSLCMVALLQAETVTATFSTDTIGPSVTIDQAGSQVDPSNATTINFTVVFSEIVTDFATGDVSLSGTAGATTGTVTGSGTTYNVAVAGMTTDGTIIPTITAAVATDSLGNPNFPSTSTDNTITFSTDTTGSTVTVNQALAQADPTTASPINFTVIFSEVVTNFITGDVTLGGTAGATIGTVTGSGTTYNVAVAGMTTDGTVIPTIAATVATDILGNPNFASTSTDNSVTFSNPSVPLSVTNLSVTSGRTYQVIQDGLQSGATVYTDRSYTFTTIPAGLLGATYIQTANADKNSQGTSFFSFDVNQPVTVYVGHDNRVSSKPSWLAGYTLTGEVWDSTDHLIDVYHQDFPTGTVTLGGNHQAQSGFSMYTVAIVSNGPPPPPPSYNLTVTLAGSGSGTVTSNVGSINCPASNCSDTYVDQTIVTLTAIAPAGMVFSGWSGTGCSGTLPCIVTIDQAYAITATFEFEYILTVQLAGLGSGTVTSNLGSISCLPSCTDTYSHGATVTLTAVPDLTMEFTSWSGTGCSGTGQCTITLLQAETVTATFSTDTTGPTVTINQTGGQADPTTGSSINFTVVFSETVSDFVTGDATINSPDGPLSHTITGSGTTYNVAVSGMTTDGLVTATIAAGIATDSSGNANSISTSTDNEVTFASSVPLSVTNLSVTSGRTYQVIQDGLQSGATVYTDRSYTFTTIPAGLLGATYIQTANADKNSQGTSFFSFDVNQPVTVYVGHDKRVSSKPSWLAGYTLTSEVWDSTDHLIDVYRQDFPTGTVTLGGNHQAQSGFSMYTIAIIPSSP